MTIKFYRKKGTDKATHQLIVTGEFESAFEEIDKGHKLDNKVFPKFNFDDHIKDDQLKDDKFNGYLKANNFEEVMDDYKTPESKLYSKVDTALERLKDQIKNNTSSGRYEILVEKAQNLIDTIEEYTLIPRVKEDDKISDIFLFNVDEKIAEFNKKNEVKFEPLKAEELQVKEDVKIPEVGKKYRRYVNDSLYPVEIKVIGIEQDLIIFASIGDIERKTNSPEFYDTWLYTLPSKMFIDIFELPEDNIEKPKTSVQEDYDKAEVVKPKSIWKDASELPVDADVSKTYLVKLGNGTIAAAVFDFYRENYINRQFQINGVIQYEVTNWVELTDYINNTEERLNKLEGK